MSIENTPGPWKTEMGNGMIFDQINNNQGDVMNMTQWKTGVPKDRKGHYLLLFPGGVICSGRHRRGHLGEPQQDVVDWRCDCCGCFGTPVAYTNHPCPEDFTDEQH